MKRWPVVLVTVDTVVVITQSLIPECVFVGCIVELSCRPILVSIALEVDFSYILAVLLS